MDKQTNGYQLISKQTELKADLQFDYSFMDLISQKHTSLALVVSKHTLSFTHIYFKHASKKYKNVKLSKNELTYHLNEG